VEVVLSDAYAAGAVLCVDWSAGRDVSHISAPAALARRCFDPLGPWGSVMLGAPRQGFWRGRFTPAHLAWLVLGGLLLRRPTCISQRQQRWRGDVRSVRAVMVGSRQRLWRG
jgi:hypothetical protein